MNDIELLAWFFRGAIASSRGLDRGRWIEISRRAMGLVAVSDDPQGRARQIRRILTERRVRPHLVAA